MRPWIEDRLADLEKAIPTFWAWADQGETPLSALSTLDRLHHVGHYLQFSDERPESLTSLRLRYTKVLDQWSVVRAEDPVRASGLLISVARLVLAKYEISVEFFCQELRENAVTHLDVVRLLREVMLGIIDSEPELSPMPYRHSLLPGRLQSEGIPDRDLTDDMLCRRRYLAVALAEVDAMEMEVPRDLHERVCTLDRQVLQALDAVVQKPAEASES